MRNIFDLIKGVKDTDNIFRERTSEEKRKLKAEEIQAKKDLIKLAAISEEMLSDQRYKELADIFKDIEKRLINLMIECDIENRDIFFLKMKSYQMDLRRWKQILRVPRGFIEKAEEEVKRTIVK